MFRWELLNGEDEALAEVGGQAFNALKTAVRKNLDDAEKEDQVEALTKVIWASMHGLVRLRLTAGPNTSDLVRLAATSAIRGQNNSSGGRFQ